MKVTVKKISELKRPERNVRMHTDKQLVEFRRSVEMFGQIRPIVIDENNVLTPEDKISFSIREIISGHHNKVVEGEVPQGAGVIEDGHQRSAAGSVFRVRKVRSFNASG